MLLRSYRRAGVGLSCLSLIVLGACSGGDGISTTTLEDGSEFIARTVAPGDGEAAVPGQMVSVHYTGWLYDPEAESSRGAKFDSSHDRGVPFEFQLGAGRVIQGWDRGVEGMLIGEVRELTIPANWAYGDRGAGAVIPPGATLLFEVELLELANPN